MDILFFICLFCVGYILGVKRTIKKFEDGDLILEPLEEIKYYNSETGEEISLGEHVSIDIETHDEHIFVYNNETGKYMAHGKTNEEIQSLLVERFPGITFSISQKTIDRITSL